MNSESLQFSVLNPGPKRQAGRLDTLYVSNYALPIAPGQFGLPEGLYQYGFLTRLVDRPGETQQSYGLSIEQASALEAAWPELLNQAIDAYAAELLAEVIGAPDLQREMLLVWMMGVLTEDPEEADDDINALKAWLALLQAAKEDKREELEDDLEEFDLFSGWPVYPPEVY